MRRVLVSAVLFLLGVIALVADKKSDPLPQDAKEKPDVRRGPRNWFKRYFWADMYSGKSAWKNALIWLVGFVGLLGLVITLIATFLHDPGTDRPYWAQWALVLWALGPPLWFWIDFFVIWKGTPADQRPDLNEFKHGQDVGRAIWVAMVGFLGLYFKFR